MNEDTGQAETETSPEPGDVGQWLRERREQRGLSVDAVAAALHLDRPIVEALERENFAAIGAAVFVKGHLKAVAHHLGLDVAEAIRRYQVSAGAAASEPPALVVSYGRPRRRGGEKALLAVLAAVVLVVLLLLWMFWPASDTPPSAPAGGQAPETTGAAMRQAADDAVSQPPAAAARTNTTEFAAMLEQARSGSAAAGGSPATTVPVAVPAAVVEVEQGLRLTFSGECWYEVRDADGRRLATGTGSAGSSRLVTGTRPFSLTLGVADAVSVTLDGQPVAIGEADRRGRAARLTVR